jgi:hypothetical protein
VTRIGVVGPGLTQIPPILIRAGYGVETVQGVEVRSDDLQPADLCLIAPFREDGSPLYQRFRDLLTGRRVPVILVLGSPPPELPESSVAGINDVLVWPAAETELLDSVRRQLTASRRMPLSSVARVRRPGGETILGCALNVSESGLLLEVAGNFSVGEALEVEFYLENDSVPVSATVTVRRSALDPERLRISYGLAFTKISEPDAGRFLSFFPARTPKAS